MSESGANFYRLTRHVAVRVTFRGETLREKVEKGQGDEMQSETGRECGSSLPL